MSTSGTGAETRYPNINGCTCERDVDDSPFCAAHEYLTKLSEYTLALMAVDLEACATDLQSRLDSALQACTKALEHVEELEDAWQRGIISEHDNKGGTRSNRNVGVRVQLRAILSGPEEKETAEHVHTSSCINNMDWPHCRLAVRESLERDARTEPPTSDDIEDWS